ncbi:gamma carbonic anhydrase family protein [Paenisporosarcina cavernae]|uniref:Gamma carbonic anhydrase family protein n=1 Tax=Paenisporosarcina cavernae TaxID=2320858 RepID=A0A385YUC9_9BACL|nr:gamma carbonic anhydrase family protein [Paenisporosarcina cavernae]AYC29910.1 gamma carbonic anhydrase family protein [Paenisporosarcina cavernae]
MIYPFNNKTPQIDSSVFIADYVTISGDVTIGADSSVWYQTVIRGDVNKTIIGKEVNIQDLCCLHQSPAYPLVLEDQVTIGHQVTLHSCTIKKGALIGMGSIILDGAIIGEGAFIGAGSLVPPGKEIPPGMLALGRPAKVVRPLNAEDFADMTRIVQSYKEKGKIYQKIQQDHQKNE